MARPLKEGLDYFPHDTDAVNDEKVEALRAIYGNDGYAFYFILLERIYRTPSAELDVSDAETKQILARKVAVTEQKFNEMLITALKRGCFDNDNYEKRGVLTSNGVKKRASVVLEKREKMRESYQKPKLNDSFCRVSDAETQKEPDKVKESKVKNNKGNNSKDIKYGEFFNVLLSAEELNKLLDRYGEKKTNELIEKLSAGIESKGYKYKSHYAAILNWARREPAEKPKDDPDKYIKGPYSQCVRRT